MVLTAAHCISERRKNFLYVRGGAHNLSNSEESHRHQNRDIDEVLTHEEFNPNSGRNDVALLILNAPMRLDETVNTICLAPAGLDLTGEQCFASGFGEVSWHRGHSPVMKRVAVPVVGKDACQRKLRSARLGHRYVLHKSFLCAGGEPNMDVCRGDGGAPLVCLVPGIINQYLQVGISSWGVRCGEDIPGTALSAPIPPNFGFHRLILAGVYADVAYLREWIDAQLQRKGIDTSSYDANHIVPLEE